MTNDLKGSNVLELFISKINSGELKRALDAKPNGPHVFSEQNNDLHIAVIRANIDKLVDALNEYVKDESN